MKRKWSALLLSIAVIFLSFPFASNSQPKQVSAHQETQSVGGVIRPVMLRI